MKNPFTVIKYFLIYRKQILKSKKYLEKNYGLNIDKIYRLWTVIDLSQIPKDLLDKYGEDACTETELKKYINFFNKDLHKLELDDLINFYEIKSLPNNKYGITFGYSQYNNLLLFLWVIGIIVALLGTITLLII